METGFRPGARARLRSQRGGVRSQRAHHPAPTDPGLRAGAGRRTAGRRSRRARQPTRGSADRRSRHADRRSGNAHHGRARPGQGRSRPRGSALHQQARSGARPVWRKSWPTGKPGRTPATPRHRGRAAPLRSQGRVAACRGRREPASRRRRAARPYPVRLRRCRTDADAPAQPAGGRRGHRRLLARKQCRRRPGRDRPQLAEAGCGAPLDTGAEAVLRRIDAKRAARSA